MLGLAGVAPVRAAEPVFPVGSTIGLVPPDGMALAGGFAGFEDRTHGASILIVDMPREAYGALEREMTASALAGKGIAEEARDALTLASGPAILVTGRQTAGAAVVRKWILLARGEVTTALVTAQAPPAADGAYPAETMRTALLSLAFKRPPPLDDQIAALPFHLGTLAGFKPLRTLAGNALYLTDGADDDASGKQAFVVVARSFGGAPDTSQIDLFARRLFTSLPTVERVRLDRAEPLRVRGVPGHEIRAEGVDSASGTPVRIVQWLRVERGGYVRLIAVVPAVQFDGLVPRLRALRDGVELR